jgi:hypothetical protein
MSGSDLFILHVFRKELKRSNCSYFTLILSSPFPRRSTCYRDVDPSSLCGRKLAMQVQYTRYSAKTVFTKCTEVTSCRANPLALARDD